MLKKSLLILIIPLLNSCVSNAEGRLIKADIKALDAKYQVLNIQLQDNKNAIDRSIKRVDVKLAELEKTLDMAKKILQKNNANFGQDMVNLQSEFQKVLGKTAEVEHLLNKVEKDVSIIKNEFDEVKANVSISTAKKEDNSELSTENKGETIQGTTDNSKEIVKDSSKKVITTDKTVDIKDPNALFKVAHKLMVDRKFAESISQFEQLIKTFPTSNKVASSKYWISQIYFATGDYKQAFFTMDAFLQEYPKSRHIPQILYQMGYSAKALKLTSDSAELFKHLIKHFPKSSYAQKAKDVLKSM